MLKSTANLKSSEEEQTKESGPYKGQKYLQEQKPRCWPPRARYSRFLILKGIFPIGTATLNPKLQLSFFTGTGPSISSMSNWLTMRAQV